MTPDNRLRLNDGDPIEHRPLEQYRHKAGPALARLALITVAIITALVAVASYGVME